MRLDLSNSWICCLHFFIEIVVKQNVILNILRHVELITKFETKLEVERKIHNSYVSFDIVTFPIYSKNNGNMVVGEIPEFFQFPKRDICISTLRCKFIICIFKYKGMEVVIRTEFINMTVLLYM